MSTSRVLRPIFGSSCRLLLDQLAPQSTRKFISSRPFTPVCPSCRHGYTLNLVRQQLRFSSSSSSSSNSTPPKPPSNSNDGHRNSTTEQYDPTFVFSPPSSSSQEPPQPETEPTSPPPPQQPPSPEPQKATNPDLPSAQNSRRSSLNQSLSAFMDRAQTTLFSASQRINDLTGYSGIETLKAQISTLETDLANAQTTLHVARAAYKHAVSERASTQREVTALLARQKTWSPVDFERFTALYRQDYELEAGVAERATELEDAEHLVERLGRELSAGILSRYHEEQIWSDKIRRMSTWGTWGLMGVNVLLFFAFQFGAEPWRRQKLVKGFEEKVREALEEERRLEEAVRDKEREIEGERKRVEALTTAATAETLPAAVEVTDEEQVGVESKPTESIHEAITIEAPPRISWREALSNPDWWKAVFADLSSDRKIAIRMRDISLIALEGAAAGATVIGTIAVVIFIRRA